MRGAGTGIAVNWNLTPFVSILTHGLSAAIHLRAMPYMHCRASVIWMARPKMFADADRETCLAPGSHFV